MTIVLTRRVDSQRGGTQPLEKQPPNQCNLGGFGGGDGFGDLGDCFVFWRGETSRKQYKNISKTNQEHVKNNSKTCQKHVNNMSKTLQKHVKRKSTTCQKLFKNMSTTIKLS